MWRLIDDEYRMRPNRELELMEEANGELDLKVIYHKKENLDEIPLLDKQGKVGVGKMLPLRMAPVVAKFSRWRMHIKTRGLRSGGQLHIGVREQSRDRVLTGEDAEALLNWKMKVKNPFDDEVRSFLFGFNYSIAIHPTRPPRIER
ncbi:hypothetical protein ACLOJK_015897 [Asimina triloba]